MNKWNVRPSQLIGNLNNWNVSQEKNQACTESEPMHDVRVMQAMLYQPHGYDGDQLSFHVEPW